MTETTQVLGVYFIDQYNFPSLYSSAEKGDALAVELMQALEVFVKRMPPPVSVCSMCIREVPRPEVPDMVIVIMRMETNSLTIWICEDCATRDDLDVQIEKIVREWPAIPENSTIEMVKDKKTLH